MFVFGIEQVLIQMSVPPIVFEIEQVLIQMMEPAGPLALPIVFGIEQVLIQMMEPAAPWPGGEIICIKKR